MTNNHRISDHDRQSVLQGCSNRIRPVDYCTARRTNVVTDIIHSTIVKYDNVIRCFGGTTPTQLNSWQGIGRNIRNLQRPIFKAHFRSAHYTYIIYVYCILYNEYIHTLP